MSRDVTVWVTRHTQGETYERRTLIQDVSHTIRPIEHVAD